MPFFAQGHFRVMTPVELKDAIESDGVPRYPVCSSNVLSTLLGDGEVVPNDNMLVLEIDPSCFLYYMNSCQGSPSDENVRRRSIFETKTPTKDTARGLLVDAETGIEFAIGRGIKKGEQLVHHFPTSTKPSGAGIDVSFPQ